MTLQVAKSAGFCVGVARAVDTVKKEMAARPLVTLGPLTHNRQVTNELARGGVHVIHDHRDAQGKTVVIRAHGIPLFVQEDMNRQGIDYIDCTCPCVKAVHHCAAQARDAGRTVIILGEASHPEVVGIIGYAGDAFFVAADAAELEKYAIPGKPYTLVAQTTFERKMFDQAAQALQAVCPDAHIHDTLCDATERRYREAEQMARQVDIMLVLGDANSANTNRLYQIAKAYCPKTYLIAAVCDLPVHLQLSKLSPSGKIGITAGASTPPGAVKEAIQFMSDITNTVETPATAAQASQSFEEMLNESFKPLHTGDIVKGTVISVSPTEIMVNLGYKSDGIISHDEMTDDKSADITQLVQPGDAFDVYVIRVNDGDGNVLVSKKKLDNQVHYKTLEDAHANKTVVSGKVTEIVKGGLLAMVENCRVFIPSSQISNRYVEDLSVFKGKTMNFHILEFDRTKRRIVAGRKELANQEHQQRRDELFEQLEIGQRLEGTVSRIVEFGAFIDLGGVDGLVHISELAWKRVRKVTDVLQVGDAVTVTVIDINPAKNKISLSLKDNDANPWNNVAEKFPIGSIIEGQVVRLASFGAFVTLEEGLDGLVHISQIADRHITKPDEVLSVGETISVKVTDVDEANHKISLSKREADAALGYTEAVEAIEEIAEDEAEAMEEEVAVEDVAEEEVVEEDIVEEEVAVEEVAAEEAVEDDAAAETVEEEEPDDEL